MDKKFNPQLVEAGKYKMWLAGGYFEPDFTGDGQPFSILLPPPNVTGHLHLGHAWDVSLQDTIIRYKKLRGYRTLWVPGMDHAGIATQTKFEKFLKKQGKPSRSEMDRETFLAQLTLWKDAQANFIRRQWAKLGLALSYDHEVFTMDPSVNEAVNTVFQQLYAEGLIYRAKTLVNWDPVLQTAISNIEVIHQEQTGKMYYIWYDATDGSERVLVATTRPETMFGDVALFVNPNDSRFTTQLGKTFVNPVNGQPLPLLTDEYVELGFGTGVMKCTPAHDFNDYALGKKHHLAQVNVLNPDGTMNSLAGKYAGMTVEQCREALVAQFQQDGVLAKVETIMNSVGHSERTGAVVQPYLSDQWFVKMKPLAEAVLKAQADGTGTQFLPPRFEHVLEQWLANIEDWCISRQLWWGHRIPVWYGPNGEIRCQATPPGSDWTQDPDVLDTWFSSALWPMVGFHWPDTTNQWWKTFFPSNVLVTGYDIIFFWVSRMLMQTRHFCQTKAFDQVLIHGLIRDEQGRKMSKSLGNGIDPMDVIDEYGCDSLRLFLTSTVSQGEDLNFSREKLGANWNFLNKLWNGARFILEQLSEHQITTLTVDVNHLNGIDHWIMARFNATLEQVTPAMDDYQFVLSTRLLTDFIWNDFFNNYLEFVKATTDIEQKRRQLKLMGTLLRNVLILLHPQCPFITEEIYQRFPEGEHQASIMLAHWPQAFSDVSGELVETGITIIDTWNDLRKFRLEHEIAGGKVLDVAFTPMAGKKVPVTLFRTYQNLLKINVVDKMAGMSGELVNRHLTMAIAYDQGAELARWQNQLAQLEAEVQRSRGILANPNFRQKAPVAKVALEEQKLADYEAQLKIVQEKLTRAH